MDVSHLRRVVRTVQSVFPHVLAFVPEASSFVILASDAPLVVDERIDERIDAAPPAFGAILEPLGYANVYELLRMLELDTPGARAFAGHAELLTDARPALEHGLAALPPSSALALHELDAGVGDTPWVAPDTIATLDVDAAFAFRIDAVFARRGALRRVERTTELAPLSESSRALVRGALAEARGDVRRAIDAYDRSDLPLASFRGERLRSDEGHWHAILVSLVATTPVTCARSDARG
jgi:hypothetical protein